MVGDGGQQSEQQVDGILGGILWRSGGLRAVIIKDLAAQELRVAEELQPQQCGDKAEEDFQQGGQFQ